MHLIFCLLPMPIFEGSNKIGSVRPSVQAFSQNSIISFFQKSDMVLESHMKLFMAAGFSGKIFFASKIGKMDQKQGFFNILENFVIYFDCICSIMKIDIICCVPAQIPYLRKFLSLRYGQNVLSQSDCRIF